MRLAEYCNRRAGDVSSPWVDSPLSGATITKSIFSLLAYMATVTGSACMDRPVFFQDDTAHFFRPLAGKYRERVRACIEALYLRLNGPQADTAFQVSRADVLEIFTQALANLPVLDDGKFTEGEGEEDVSDEKLAAYLLTRLRDDGWLEDYHDDLSMKTAFRFTPVGPGVRPGLRRAAPGPLPRQPPQHAQCPQRPAGLCGAGGSLRPGGGGPLLPGGVQTISTRASRRSNCASGTRPAAPATSWRPTRLRRSSSAISRSALCRMCPR